MSAIKYADFVGDAMLSRAISFSSTIHDDLLYSVSCVVLIYLRGEVPGIRGTSIELL